MTDDLTFRATMSRIPTFVSVITAAGATGPVGCTATAVLSLSVHPPTLLVSLRTGGRTLAGIETAGEFAVNVLSWEQRDLSTRFAAGDPARRFDGVPHLTLGGVPALATTTATLVCRLDRTIPALDHTLLIGAVTHTTTSVAEPMILLDGAPHPAALGRPVAA